MTQRMTDVLHSHGRRPEAAVGPGADALTDSDSCKSQTPLSASLTAILVLSVSVAKYTFCTKAMGRIIDMVSKLLCWRWKDKALPVSQPSISIEREIKHFEPYQLLSSALCALQKRDETR